MLDRYLGHGYNVAGLAPSTYERTLATSLSTGYPMGSLMPLGVGHTLARHRHRLALAAVSLLPGRDGRDRTVRAVRAARPRPVASCARGRDAPRAPRSSTATRSGAGSRSWPKRRCSSSSPRSCRAFLRAPGRRAALPLAVAAAATVGRAERGRRRVARRAGGDRGRRPLAPPDRRSERRGGRRPGRRPRCALAIPTLSAATMWFNHTGAFTSGNEFGNLIHRARLVADLRHLAHRRLPDVGTPERHHRRADRARRDRRRPRGRGRLAAPRLRPAHLRGERARRQLDLLARGLSVDRRQGDRDRVSALLSASRSSRPAWVYEHGRRVEAVLAAAAIVFGVAWSDALAYHDAFLAPSARLSELEAIGQTVRRPGPDARDGLRPLRCPALPAQARRRGDVRAARPPDLAADRRRAADRRVGRPRRDRTRGRARLPDDRPAHAHRPRAGRRRSTSRPGRDASLPGLATARLGRADDRRAPVPRRPASTRRPSRAAPTSCGSRRRRGRAGGSPRSSGRRTPPSISAARRPARGAVRRDGRTRVSRRNGDVRASVTTRRQTGSTRSGSTGRGGACSRCRSTDTGSPRQRQVQNWPSEYEPLATVRLTKGEHRVTLRYTGPTSIPAARARASSGSGRS